VKAASQSHPDANYVHVEIYENLDAVTTEDLRIVAAVRTWGLPSEPWVFVVDANGEVAARFEGALTDEELEIALEEVGA
jgi:predicted transcriptional regulator